MNDIWQNIKDRVTAMRLPMSLPSRINTDSRFLKPVALVTVVVLGLYYPVGMLIVHKVDDNIGYQPAMNPGESEAVAYAAGLMKREIEENRWVAMDPFFMPGSALDNMQNFQKGMVSAISRFAIEMADQIGRVRGSSQVDEDLDKAAGLFKYKPDVWVYDVSESWLPQRSSAQQYMLAVKSFENYNRRLAEGNAIFERRADNLLATIDRITTDLGSASAVIASGIQDLSPFSLDADDVFYRTKGRLYAYYLILKGLKVDYANVIEERKLTKAWDQMLFSMQEASRMDPVLVTNAAPDSLILPSHLAGQGFYLLRARTQLREISNVLLK